jgi:beta-glucosidase
MKSFFYTLLFVFAIFIFSGYQFNNASDLPAYKNNKLSIKQRVDDLLQKMTLEEKVGMIGGTGFETKPIERLGIPSLKMTDGPVGVRWGISTAYPSGISMGATWNPSLINRIGHEIARDVKSKGRNVILGPCVNIARIPMGGRDFESYGEDPFLTSRLAVDYIKGVQAENVAATIKHFACNNQEYQRDFVNVIIDDRALNEIYLPAFKAGVTEGNVYCVMSAYNKLNGEFCSANKPLLIDKLKDEWGFKGLVMSDWGAVHSTLPTYNNGLDIEMPTGKYLNESTLIANIKNGTLSVDKLNDKIKRILTIMFKIGLFDKSDVNSTKRDTEVALDAARESIVLLKNDNILPLTKAGIRTLAILGPSAKNTRVSGGGSSMVDADYVVSPFNCISNEFGKDVNINYAQGVTLQGDSNPIDPSLFSYENKPGIKAEYFNNMNLSGKPAKVLIESQINNEWHDNSPMEGINKVNFSVRWTTTLRAPHDGNYVLDIVSDDGSRLYIDNKLVINDWTDHAAQNFSTTISFRNNEAHTIVLEYYQNAGDATIKLGWRLPDDDLIKDAVAAAQKSDVALIFAGTSYLYESEGFDRDNIDLPENQNKLIEEVSKVNNNVIVVLSTGQPVTMPWKDKVKGIIESWFGGEKIGFAITDVLTGKYNPSGKLPVTFPKRWEDCSANSTYKKQDGITNYSDGIFVGYRHFDKYKIEPLFPFGFGLSYTTFKYDNLSLSSGTIAGDGKINVTFNVKNTGKQEGAEIVELYITDVHCSVERPAKELKGFRKVFLKPGETGSVEFTIDKNSLGFYDTNTSAWKYEPGEFKVLIGSSSQDIKLQSKFILQ